MNDVYKLFKKIVDGHLEKLSKEHLFDIYSINYMELIYDLAENESIDYSNSIVTNLATINDLFKDGFYNLIQIKTYDKTDEKQSVFSLNDGVFDVLFAIKWEVCPSDEVDCSKFPTMLRKAKQVKIIKHDYEIETIA